jgi:hypothetical protein
MSTRAPNPATGSRKISFNVSEQYDIQDVVGEGAYGVVWYVDSYGIVPPLPSDFERMANFVLCCPAPRSISLAVRR